jgi:beta-lactamase superfamily II metal-dependent hydrolase
MGGGVLGRLPGQHASVRVQVIDRGQADGVLIRTPHDQWVVIDAGTDRLQAEAMASVWGVDTVALAIVSHRHRDHFGGMDDVLRRFPVRRFVGNLADCPDRAHDDTIRAILASRRIPAQSAGADTIEVDGVRFIVLPPDPVDDPCPEHENDNSILVRLEFGGFAMLFTGDAETAERQWLMANHPELLTAAVLKASHHGSRNGADGAANGRTWTDVVAPRAVVISALLQSRHKHPHREAIEAYETAVGRAKVHCTSRHGTVRIYGRPNGTFSVSRQFAFAGSCEFPG